MKLIIIELNYIHEFRSSKMNDKISLLPLVPINYYIQYLSPRN
jgi:hypothetical protein